MLLSALSAQDIFNADYRPVETFAQQIERRIDEEMFYPSPLRGEPTSGFVHVAFKLDADGTPYDICIAKRVSFSLDRAAVSTIKGIGPLTHGIPGKRYMAVLQYADLSYDVGATGDMRVLKQELKEAAAKAVFSAQKARRCTS
jgi:TonB family protein